MNRRVWVGQEEGRVIKIYDANGTYVTTISRGPKTPENPGYTRNVTDIDFFGGKAYIADEQYDKIKVVDANTFTELTEIDVYNGSGWSGAHGLGIDPATGNLFVATYTRGPDQGLFAERQPALPRSARRGVGTGSSRRRVTWPSSAAWRT